MAPKAPTPRTLIISFGAGLEAPGGILNRQRPAGLSTAARALAAAILAQEHPASTLLFSGRGTVKGYTEAEAMRDIVIQNSNRFPVDPHRIVLEMSSIDTAESVRRCVAMIREHPALKADQMFLVTGPRHLRRSARYFRAYGFPVKAFATRDVLAPYIEQFPEFKTVDSHSPSPRERLEEFLHRLVEVMDPRGTIVSRIAHWKRR